MVRKTGELILLSTCIVMTIVTSLGMALAAVWLVFVEQA